MSASPSAVAPSPRPRKENSHAHLASPTQHLLAPARPRDLQPSTPRRTSLGVAPPVRNVPGAVHEGDVVVEQPLARRVLELHLVATDAADQAVRLRELVRHAAVVGTGCVAWEAVAVDDGVCFFGARGEGSL
ncbi:hypothetical protein PMIN03_012485 [Paraphaeosphaeria minitans]